MKPQKQNRPKKRAKHGSPLYSKQFGFWCTPGMHKVIMRIGGSQRVREALRDYYNIKEKQ